MDAGEVVLSLCESLMGVHPEAADAVAGVLGLPIEESVRCRLCSRVTCAQAYTQYFHTVQVRRGGQQCACVRRRDGGRARQGTLLALPQTTTLCSSSLLAGRRAAHGARAGPPPPHGPPAETGGPAGDAAVRPGATQGMHPTRHQRCPCACQGADWSIRSPPFLSPPSLPCFPPPQDLGGCGCDNVPVHTLERLPLVFTLHLGWRSHSASAADIAGTLAAIDERVGGGESSGHLGQARCCPLLPSGARTASYPPPMPPSLPLQVDLCDMYAGVVPHAILYRLRAMVCCSGTEHVAFTWVPDAGGWLLFAETAVTRVGAWADVQALCREGLVQPLLLFHAAAL